MIGGLVIVGAGAIIVGAEFAIAPILGLWFIAYGISIALPATWELIERRIDQWWEKTF